MQGSDGVISLELVSGSAAGMHPHPRCAGLPPEGEARNLAPLPGW